ncbi:XRE family transcriptional regulator [Pilimelia columellifera]|uniref:XRE family transcriptional regulator n=1 Tax=Pilimelia columellifera subsp. columellifera TaxID=706583 RepID=A0ABP6AWN7_9ACTN
MVLAYEKVATEMDRRSLITGTLATIVVPSAVAELIKHGFSSALNKRASVEEWLDKTQNYGTGYMQVGASEMQSRLASDLVVLQQNLEHPQLWGVAARLMTVYGKTLPSNEGNSGAIEWYRLAAVLADRSEDNDMRVWVRGRAALALAYEGASLRFANDLANQAIGIDEKPSLGRLNALVARAHVAGHRGDTKEALKALRASERVADVALSEVLVSDFAVPEWRYHTFTSMLLSRLGLPEAEHAQDQADQTRPSTLPRFATHIELHRALMMVKQGDRDAGISYARTALDKLPPENRSLSLKLMMNEIKNTI